MMQIKIFRRIVVLTLFLSSIAFSFGQQTLTVTADANSAGMFRLSGSNPLIDFVQNHPEAVIEISGVIDGLPIKRYVDNDAALASGNYYLEFFTTTRLNQGELTPQVYKAPVDLVLTALVDKPNLFPSQDLFNEESEIERVLAIDKIAETYLSDPAHRRTTKRASRIPLSILRGEELVKNVDGTPPYFHELMAITNGYPRSYQVEPRLGKIAKHVIEKESDESQDLEDSVELGRGQAKLPITLIEDKKVKEMGLPYSRLKDLAREMIPARLFNTGNAYPDPNLDVYRTFRLPGETCEAISLNDLAKAVIKKNGDQAADSVEHVAIEVTAYNGYTWNFRSVDPEVFLIVPEIQAEDPLFLVSCNNVDADGKPLTDVPLGVFAVKSINFIYLK